MDYRQEFEQAFAEHVTRPGADKLLEWLTTTDFYTCLLYTSLGAQWRRVGYHPSLSPMRRFSFEPGGGG